MQSYTMTKLSLLCCLAVVLFAPAPLWASPVSPVGEIVDQPGMTAEAITEAMLHARYVAEENELEAAAAAIDPSYGVLQRKERALYKELVEKLEEAGVDWTDEAGISGEISADAARLLARHSRLVEELEVTKGNRWLLQERADRVNREMGSPETANPRTSRSIQPLAIKRTFNVYVFRDNSSLDSSWDTTLKNLTTTALGDIKSAYEARRPGDTFNWVLGSTVGTYNLTGCNPSIPYGGSGNTFYVYYRRSESRTNGWASYGSYALIDLLPATCDGIGASVNWFDQNAATHEIAHVFTADHRTKSACSSTWNDFDCGTDSSCGYKGCDAYSYCNMEYADANVTRSFCGSDAFSIACWVDGGGTGCGSAQ